MVGSPRPGIPWGVEMTGVTWGGGGVCGLNMLTLHVPVPLAPSILLPLAFNQGYHYMEKVQCLNQTKTKLNIMEMTHSHL